MTDDEEWEGDDGYRQRPDGSWFLTPKGLAEWMDQEGGLAQLMTRNGPQTFIEAGCSPEICLAYVAATNDMEAELERIGAII